MFCKECGTEFTNDAAGVCLNCGMKKGNGNSYCPTCGHVKKSANQDVCLNCGDDLKRGSSGSKNKLVALLLALFLGGFGGHLFYVGKNSRAILYIALTISSFFTCGITGIVLLVLEIIDIVQICSNKFTDSTGAVLTEWN